MKKMLFVVVLLALVSFDSEAMAQEESDQPLQGVFQTELVYPQEKGAFQFTSTSTFARGNKRFSNDPAASAKKGISECKIEYEPYVILAKDFPGLSRLQLFSQLGLSFAHSLTRSTASDENLDGKTVEWNSGMFVPYRKARFSTEINWSKGAEENNLYLTYSWDYLETSARYGVWCGRACRNKSGRR